jgi:hypothetical protein
MAINSPPPPYEVFPSDNPPPNNPPPNNPAVYHHAPNNHAANNAANNHQPGLLQLNNLRQQHLQTNQQVARNTEKLRTIQSKQHYHHTLLVSAIGAVGLTWLIGSTIGFISRWRLKRRLARIERMQDPVMKMVIDRRIHPRDFGGDVKWSKT